MPRLKRSTIRISWQGTMRTVPYVVEWPFTRGIVLVACGSAGPVGVVKAFDYTEARALAYANFWPDELGEDSKPVDCPTARVLVAEHRRAVMRGDTQGK